MSSDNDLAYMQRALSLARQGAAAGEVPVGAVLVLKNQIIAEGFNQPIALHDPCAHAEVLVLRAAASVIQNYRILGATLYVTLEPCLMCVGAMVHARIGRLVFAASDPKTGAVTSQLRGFDQPFLNHKVNYEGGLLSEECGQVLSGFFKDRRN
jgi:tRNA(adenine34) deaminase